MQANERFSVRFGMVFVLALLLCAPMAMAQSGRISMQGHVTGLIADGAGYRVTLDNGGYSYWVPAATITDRNIRVGDYVRFGGYGHDGLVTVDDAAYLGGPNYRADRDRDDYRADRYYNGQPMYSSAPENAVSGTIQYVNRHYNYLDMRADGTGRMIRVDVRNMDTRGSVNVWRLRPGDHVNVTGGWENRGRWQADRVFF